MTLQTPSTRLFLLTSALACLGLGGCDKPKQIGDETQGVDSEGESEGETKGESESDSEGGECQAGDTKYDACGNQICTCEEDVWQCIFIGCEQPEPACEPGDKKMIECNDCVCDAEGHWDCDKKGCEEPQPVCNDGDKKMIECNACVCADGQWACDDQSCEPEPACKDGDEKQVDCNTCSCLDGDWACTEIDCKPEPDVCPVGDPKTIENAKIVGDTLVADLTYGGGCEDHFVEMCWDGLFAESEPVQVWVNLVHEDNDDPCDAILHEQHVIDLKPLKTSYQDAYQTETGKITIHVDEWKDALLYSF